MNIRDELIDFLVGHIPARDLADFQASQEARNRVWTLIATDVGSVLQTSRTFTRLFNPRIDRWDEHFALDESRIIGLTEVGQVTVNLLRLNDDERVLERRFLGRIGEYPGRRPSG